MPCKKRRLVKAGKRSKSKTRLDEEEIEEEKEEDKEKKDKEEDKEKEKEKKEEKTEKKGKIARKDKENTKQKHKEKEKEESINEEDKTNDKTEDTKEEQKRLENKGTAKVDRELKNKDQYTVYGDDTGSYHASLVYTDLKYNNNKFYIGQILYKKSTPDKYYVFFRWGRVGYKGMQSFTGGNSLEEAIKIYKNKIDNKISEGYDQIGINFEEEKETEVNESSLKSKKKDEATQKVIESKLDKRVQDIIKLIFNSEMITKEMENIGYDIKKMPLGKLSKETIRLGFEALKKISDVLDGAAGDLLDLSSEFYKAVPHDFGYKKMRNFVINTNVKLKSKLEMVQTLGDIEIASRLMEKKANDKANMIDQYYDRLNCSITAIEQETDEFKILDEYVINTHGSTHSFKVKIENAFKLSRNGEEDRYNNKIGNDMMLWHGSRMSNFIGILSQGLRIAPPEAPVTGYMFGKGIYFADMVTKSAQYCYASNTNQIGLMLLVRVAVGKTRTLYNADSNANKLPEGAHCTLGLGKLRPPETSYKKFRGMLVPVGKAEQTDDKKVDCLQYNEYIVYSEAQAKLEYLLKMKFN